MFTQYIKRGWTGDGVSLEKTITVTGGGRVDIDESIAAAAANALVALTLDVSQIKSLFITSNRAMTLETNSAGSPVNVITLAADVPFQWVFGDPPLRDTAGTAVTTDITALYATNDDADNAALLQIRCLIDPTV